MRINFYRITTQIKLHSFGDLIGLVPIGKSNLKTLQEEYVKASGGNLVDIKGVDEIKESGPYFIFSENLFFTKPFLESCISLSTNQSSNLQFCLKENTFNERNILPTTLDDGENHNFDLKYIQNNTPFIHCSIPQEIFEYKTSFPSQLIKGRDYHVDQCETFACHIISPFHLLFVNLAVNLSKTIKLQKRIPKILMKWFGKPDGKWFYRGLKSMNIIGENCKIHPSAILEGVELGDNVTIGANAVIRLSMIGHDSYVAENNTVINSVLAERTCIANSNYISGCLTYPEVFLIHGPYHVSVFGENSACFAVINCDIRLDQENIKIPTSEGIIDSKQAILGVAYGHNSKTGGGNIIAAGRIVPNNINITPPDSILLNFDDFINKP